MKKIILTLILLSNILFCHSGKTDSNGGHYNRTTGEYHFHNNGYNHTNYIKNENFTCGTKKYCGQMTSCKEAYFYYSNCGLARLDGDKDGIPCENLCR